MWTLIVTDGSSDKIGAELLVGECNVRNILWKYPMYIKECSLMYKRKNNSFCIL